MTLSSGTWRIIGWLVLLIGLAVLPLFIHSGRWIDFLEMTLFAAVLGQGWNILGGYGGQYSFGHALFFGTAAYVQALLQYKLGWSPWVAMWFAVSGSVMVASCVGYLSFRYGLRGSYFALVTLAFAEAFHVLSGSLTSITEGGHGVQVALNQDPEQALTLMQYNFAGPFLQAYGYYYSIFAILVVTYAATGWMMNSRFGAQLMAIRENEEAAEAIGIYTTRVKVKAIAVSAAITATCGVFYVQKFLYIEPGIAYGPSKSIEALVAPIIGGLGTVLGPLLGAAFMRGLGETTKSLVFEFIGTGPGIDLIVFGIVLILVLAFLPRGLVGLLEWLWRRVRMRYNA